MAIVFVSGQRKQRIFFWAVALASVLFLAVISFSVFLPDLLVQSPKTPLGPGYKPVITINSGVLDSQEVGNLSTPEDLPSLEGMEIGRPNPFITY